MMTPYVLENGVTVKDLKEMATDKSPKSRKPHPDSQEYGKHVHLSLKAAFSLIKKSMNEGLYMPAYVTAFSIVEDRLFAMYVVAKRVSEGVKDVKRNYKDSLLKCADYLV